jgi:anti-sigma regulatory factor (Ser/Thr protein kinase)
MRSTRRFANSPASVTQARRYVREHLDGTPPDVADAVTVMTSELATNSIRHAGSDFEVGIDRSGQTIRVDVTDRGAGTPTVLAPGPEAPSGRGMRIVSQLADDWGVTPAGDGGTKTVWFTVTLPTG